MQKKVADFWHVNGYCDNGGTRNLYKLIIELRAVNKCHCQKRGFYFHLRTLLNQLISILKWMFSSPQLDLKAGWFRILKSLRYLGNLSFSQMCKMNKETWIISVKVFVCHLKLSSSFFHLDPSLSLFSYRSFISPWRWVQNTKVRVGPSRP